MTESILGRAKVPISADLSQLNEDLKRAHKNIEEKLSGALKSVGKKMTSLGKGLTAGLTAPILGLGAVVVTAASDFESAFAGVRKTVDATEEEYAALAMGIRDMATRTKDAVSATPEEIAAVMEMAGQLGISKENLLGFTETMVKLGVTTNMSSDEAAVALARLANITQMPQDQFDELGSAIVALGNNLATTEADIVNMALRLAGAGSVLDMSNAQILGIAGALSSVGIEAQAGGSAFSRVMIDIANTVASATTGVVDNTEAMAKQRATLALLNSQLAIAEQRQSEFTDKTAESTRMSNQLRMDKYRDEIAATEEMLAQLETSQGRALDPKKLQKFAEVAGMHVGEFRDLFEMDAAAAIITFVEGLGRMRDEGEDVFGVLDELGLSETRVRDALLRASGAGDLFRRAMNLSSDAWGENIALTEEAEKRYATFTEQLKIVKNRINDVAITIGTPLIPILKDLMDRYLPPLITSVETLAIRFADLDPEVQSTAVQIGLVAAAIGPLLLLLAPLVTMIGTIGLPTLVAGLAIATLAASFFLGSEKGEIFRETMHVLSEDLSDTRGIKNLGKWVSTIADLLDVLAKFGKGEYGLLFLITGKRPKEFFGEITEWGKGFFGTWEKPGALGAGQKEDLRPLEEALAPITEWGREALGTAGKPGWLAQPEQWQEYMLAQQASHQRIVEMAFAGMPSLITKELEPLIETTAGATIHGGLNITIYSPDPDRAGADVIAELKARGYLP